MDCIDVKDWIDLINGGGSASLLNLRRDLINPSDKTFKIQRKPVNIFNRFRDLPGNIHLAYIEMIF